MLVLTPSDLSSCTCCHFKAAALEIGLYRHLPCPQGRDHPLDSIYTGLDPADSTRVFHWTLPTNLIARVN